MTISCALRTRDRSHPHQYVRRARIRAAARLVVESGKVVHIALICGFGDVSNFNRARSRRNLA